MSTVELPSISKLTQDLTIAIFDVNQDASQVFAKYLSKNVAFKLNGRDISCEELKLLVKTLQGTKSNEASATVDFLGVVEGGFKLPPDQVPSAEVTGLYFRSNLVILMTIMAVVQNAPAGAFFTVTIREKAKDSPVVSIITGSLNVVYVF